MNIGEIFHIFICILHILQVYYSQSDQLPDGLIAQWVEHYTGIAEVMGSNLYRSGLNFLQR